MEHLWNPAGASSGKQRQIGHPPKPRQQAKYVAARCDWLSGGKWNEGSTFEAIS